MINQDTIINSFEEIDLQDYDMPLICVYASPEDFKEMYVARLFDLDKPTHYLLMRPSLESIRKEIPDQFNHIPRSPQDDPKIVETWV
ncbi:hypothetical protein [Rossellomorea sp. BNER]|uniref:hypothetical protein n=1 Tax=Rossellomorea sp. BNER TaxID=2962031 RepID=UPI003AF24969|nr:hypothetical protein [Rossellomorea sp. BNER]